MKLLPLSRSFLFISAMLLTPGISHPADVETVAPDKVSLNFANADIASVVMAIGKISGKNFLIDPRVKGTLNIVTNTPVSRDLAYQILLSALRLQGITAVEGAGIIKILPEADAKLHGVPVSSAHRQSQGDALITRVFPMKHESATQMLAVVRPLVSPNNTVTAFPSNNVLVVTDYADNLRRIENIIASVDVAQGDVTVIELKHAIAIDLANTLQKLMQDNNTASADLASPTQQLQIIAEPRTNSLLVRANDPAKLRAVRQLASSLDLPGAGGNIHVIYLRNADARAVANTLNAALSGKGTALQQPVNHSSPAKDNSNSGGNTSTDASTIEHLAQNPADNISQQGIVQADPLNNALIIAAPDAVYRNLRTVIDQLDRRRAQVYIEALIAEISSDRAAEFGIQWQSSNIPQGGKSAFFGGTNFGGGGQNIIGGMRDLSSLGKGMNLLIGGGTVRVPINGKMVDIFSLSMLARLLESDSRTNILSAPNLLTLDNETAKIVVGRNLPFVTGQYTNQGNTATNPFQTIKREDVGLTLEVRPQISQGGTIKLEIYQEASSVVGKVDATLGPSTNKRSIKSTVLVDDGNIVALGGLVEDSFSAGEEKVPFLGDIPVAGNLFRYRSRKRAKTNLVIFLRPIIVRDEQGYQGITQSRYNYVIGQQKKISEPVGLMLKENNAPTLPAFGKSMTQDTEDRNTTAAPIEEAVIKPVYQTDLTR